MGKELIRFDSSKLPKAVHDNISKMDKEFVKSENPSIFEYKLDDSLIPEGIYYTITYFPDCGGYFWVDFFKVS